MPLGRSSRLSVRMASRGLAKLLAKLNEDLADGKLLTFLLCVFLSAAIFVTDLSSLPLGVAAGVAYVAVVLISLLLPAWQYTIFFSVITSVLTLLGLYLKEPSATPWIVIANRVLAVTAIWLTAMTGIWLVHGGRKKSEDALRAQESRHSGALQKAMQDADRARNAKLRFLETASDYLRQRLQALSLLNGTLRKVVTESRAQEIFALQFDEVLRLKNLLDSLLDISELDSGDVEVMLTETPITEIFEALDVQFSCRARAKGLELQFESENEVAYSDRKLLTQIIRNMLSNAIRYTNRGGIRVLCRRDADDLIVTVEDSGIGMAPDQLDLIFDEFYRVEKGSANRQGNFGLGLSIVERGAKLLGITIEVASQVGQGSRFSFLVPAAGAGCASRSLSKSWSARTSR